MPRRDKTPWSWQGATAVALAFGVLFTVSVICFSQASKLMHGLDLSPAGINLLTAVLSALVGATGVFLGKVAGPGVDTPPANDPLDVEPPAVDGLDATPAKRRSDDLAG
jgi:hypothetical protein